MKYSTLVIIAASLSTISALPIIPGHPLSPHEPDVPRGILKREAEAEAATPEHHPSTANTPDIPRDILKREADPEAYWGQYKGGKTDPHTLEKREAEAYEGQHKGGKTDPHTIGKREAEPEAEAYWGQYKGGKTDPHTIEKREAEPEAATPEHHPSTRNTPDIPRDILKREAEPEAYEGQYKGGKTDPHTIGKREAKNDGKVPGRTVPIPKIN